MFLWRLAEHCSSVAHALIKQRRKVCMETAFSGKQLGRACEISPAEFSFSENDGWVFPRYQGDTSAVLHARLKREIFFSIKHRNSLIMFDRHIFVIS